MKSSTSPAPGFLAIHCIAFLLSAASAAENESGFRIWTNAEGREIAAELRSADESKVDLFLKGGKEATVPLASLSESDQAYVNAWLLRRQNDWNIEITGTPSKANKVSRELSDDGKVTVTLHIDAKADMELHLMKVDVKRPPNGSPPKFEPQNFKMLVRTLGQTDSVALKHSLITKKPESLSEEGEFELIFEIPKNATPLAIRYGDQPEIRI